MIDVTRADTIKGWTSKLELEWLAEQASKRKNIVEIGSWMGRSAVAMATNTVGKVLAVDTWQGTPEDGHFRQLEGKPADWLIQQFIDNKTGVENLTWIQGRSTTVASLLSQVPQFDMIFIDGDHSYAAVKADIIAWLPLMLPGGLLCHHDYDGGRPGCVKAIREMYPRIKPVGIGSLCIGYPHK